MKRVLSIATLYPNAEQPRFGTFVARQMEALAARGDWDVTVINPIGVPPLALGRYKAMARAAVSAEENGVFVHRPRFTLIPALGGPLNPAMIARSVLPMARRLHAERPLELVDAQFFYPDGPAAACIARALRQPLSIKARGADISYWGHKPYARRQMLRAAEQANGLLAVSQALKAGMAAIGLPGDRITVHYTGLEKALFQPMDRQNARAELPDRLALSFAPDTTLLASVGALIPRKRQELVIRALPSLPATHLLLVGDGPDRRTLDSMAQASRVADRVHFLGSLGHAELAVVLSACNAMVLPSKSEGLANAWVEALACGCPLVITDAGGARELVTCPEAGRIVDPSPEAIARGVREVLADQTPPEVVGKTVARFSWQANAAALAEYYEGLLAR